jgi:hypothetical protein
MTMRIIKTDTSTVAGKIKVMQAWLDGKEIARKHEDYDDYTLFSDHHWNWDYYDHQIVEEPREMWINYYGPDKQAFAHHTIEKALQLRLKDVETIRFREVIE